MQTDRTEEVAWSELTPALDEALAGLYKLAAAKRKNSSAEWGWNAIWVCMS
jgi:hypothetical protein